MSAKAAVSEHESGVPSCRDPGTAGSLAERCAMLQLTLDTIGQGVCAFDRDLALVAWNSRASEILDIPPDSVRPGCHLRFIVELLAARGFYGDVSADAIVAERVEAVNRNRPFAFDRTLPNGRVIQVRGSPFGDGGFLATFTDVTDERRRAHDLMLQARYFELHGRIAAYANEATDLETALRRFVGAICDDLGYEIGHVNRLTPDGLRSAGILFDRTDSARTAEERLATITVPTAAAVEALAAGDTITGEHDPEAGDLGRILRLSRLPGLLAFPVRVLAETFVVECYGARPIRAKPWHRSAIAQLEAQLGRVAERERVARLKDEFVSTVSHELRTPITSVAGMLELLDSGLFGTFPDEVAGMLRIALRDSRRLGKLIENILDIHRVEHDGPLDLKPHRLALLVRTAIGSVASTGRIGVPIAIQESDPDVVALADAASFSRIMENVLSNAVKFTRPDSTIQVQIGHRDGWVRTSVADRGPGIPETFRPYVFDKFSQADGSDTRRTAGSGLGLAITKRLVERLGGRIGFDCPASEGTTFHIDLPAAPLPRAA